MTQCKAKSPVFVSRPHFYLADQSYLTQFQHGLSPDQEKHDSAFWLEPLSSIPLKVDMRLQLNVLVRKVEGIEYLFKNLPEVMFPVFWFESLSEIPEDMPGSLNMLVILPTLIQFTALSTILTSLVIIATVVTYQIMEHHKHLRKLEQVKSVSKIIPDYEYRQVPIVEITSLPPRSNIQAVRL